MYRIESDVNIKSKSNENNRLRKSSGLDKQTLERIAAERAEMEGAEKEQKTRLPGGHFGKTKRRKHCSLQVNIRRSINLRLTGKQNKRYQVE